MKLSTLTARVVFAIECVPEDTKIFVTEVNKTREQLRAERQAKLNPQPAAKPLRLTHQA
jgi:hypothetical protein